ncbi:HPr family phosphocarrier protein [Streptomyces sp. NBC_00481]|uniref:HPr family phosphocarrier protein n=1 Tax=unclassified Streptomyces TaxID=2593676 RepID=UPI002DDBDF7D|nr:MULTISPECIES: HPr family phosphocarrier protein [unclassified Streptomyces]WRY98360.1 HPr family phosphocarrier protein [Streptomyces sp. NBC_00481]
MPERRVTIGSQSGLHARPASLIVQAAAKSGASVTLTKGDVTVDAASILGVMRLGAGRGDEVLLRTEGVDADQALHELSELLEGDLDAMPAP